MRFTNRMKANGEMAMRTASEKARKFYDETDPLKVYEYEGEDGSTLYAYTGCFGDRDGLTFEELQEMFEDLQDEVEKVSE